MADPLKQMCEELGVCKEEALFYLEGFRWDLNAAMEACRNKTLPSPSLTAQPPSENEKIKRFKELTEASVEEARYYLSRNNWNVENAFNSFLGLPLPLSHDDHTEHGFSGNEGSDMTQDVLYEVPMFHDTSRDLRIGSPYPSASTPPPKLTQESIKQFHEIVPSASPTAILDCLNHCNGNVNKAISHYYEGYNEKYESLPDEIKEELIASFSSTTGATRQVANLYLEQYEWDLERAINFYFEHGDSEKQTSALPLPSMGLPSQSYVSSGSMETQRSLEDAAEGDVTVAIPRMASSEVDGKAVEEGSSKETVPNPSTNRDRATAPSTIMITIELADRSEASLELPFRSNQTVRDIRNAIDQRYPDNDRGYFLQSQTGVEYMDWNITVYRVSTGGSTTLYQTYP